MEIGKCYKSGLLLPKRQLLNIYQHTAAWIVLFVQKYLLSPLCVSTLPFPVRGGSGIRLEHMTGLVSGMGLGVYIQFLSRGTCAPFFFSHKLVCPR